MGRKFNRIGRWFTALTLTGLFLGGCNDTKVDGGGDNNSDLAELVPKPTVSGKAILADTGEGLPQATVRLRIGGEWYETTTAGGENNERGDFVFTDVPSLASFFIEIDPKEDDYASSYTFGTTNKTDSGQSATDALNDLSFDVGEVAVYEAAPTSIKAYDVDTGEPITGLGMWIEPADFGTGNSLTSGEIATPYVRPDAAEGQYTFDLPRKGEAVDVYVNGLVDSEGVVYQTLAGDLLQPGNLDGECAPVSGPTGETLIDPCDTNTHDDGSFEASKLTALSPAVDSPLYLRKYSPSELTVNFELLDANGGAYEAGRAITVHDVESGQVFAAEQSESQTNLYSIVIPYERDLEFAVASIDTDGDGLKDTSTELVYDSVDRKSGQSEATLAVTISELTDYTPIEAEVVSASLVPNQVAEAVIVFNQPVVPTGTNAAQARYHDLEDDVAGTYEDDGQSTYTENFDHVYDGDGNTITIENFLTQKDAPDADEWDYADDQNNDRTFTLPGADGGTGKIVDPFERKVDTTENIVTATASATNSTNTVYRISIDAASISDRQQVSFTLTVRSEVTGEVERVSIAPHSAESTNTFAGLTDIVLDDGDFENDANQDVLDTNPGLHVSRNGALTYTIADTQDNCGGSADCEFIAAKEPSDFTVGMDRQLALVSPKAFYGHVQLVEYVYESNEAGSAVQHTEEVYNDPIIVAYTDAQIEELTAGAHSDCSFDGDKCERGDYYYFLKDPENEDLDPNDTSALTTVFGSNVQNWAKGYARSTGLGYAVSMADLEPTLDGGNLLKSMTLDVDIIIDGVRHEDTVTLTVN